MLAEMDNCNNGLCHLSGKIFGIYPYDYLKCNQYEKNIEFKKIYPELWSRRPRNYVAYWFKKRGIEGREKRIELLKQCIEETC